MRSRRPGTRLERRRWPPSVRRCARTRCVADDMGVRVAAVQCTACEHGARPSDRMMHKPGTKWHHMRNEREQRLGSLRDMNDISHHRVNVVLPALAAEHAVVADVRLHIVGAHVGAQAAREVLRGECLADRADVVALALDGDQRGTANCGGVTVRPRKVNSPWGKAYFWNTRLTVSR